MNNLEFFQKFRKNFPYIFIYRSSTETAADYKQNRLLGSEAAVCAGAFLVSVKKLLADRRSGKDCLILGKTVYCFREVASDF